MRISRDHLYLLIARVTSFRRTCPRRAVGCALVDSKGRLLSTGYNGTPSGLGHCIAKEENRCEGALFSSGEGLDKCCAVHAEQNALLQCKSVDDIATCYVTTQPCCHCLKLLLNTPCQRIVYEEPYPQPPGARDLWAEAGREMVCMAIGEASDETLHPLDGWY